MKLQDLPIFEVKRVIQPKDADEIVGVIVPEATPNVTEAGIYVDADTKEPVLAYMPLPKELVAPLRNAVLKVSMQGVPRGQMGFVSQSRTFGMAPRLPLRRRESCRATSLAVESPKEHKVIADLAGHLAKYMEEMFADIYKHDKEVMAQVEEEWKIGERDLWTSGVINQSAALPFHRDNFNFDVWSAMPVIRNKMDGGCLTLVEYDATVACRDGWVLFFAGYKHVHGVTPMVPKADNGYRYSIVYYALKGMKDCFTAAVETAKAREKRIEREENLAKALKGEQEFSIRK